MCFKLTNKMTGNLREQSKLWLTKMSLYCDLKDNKLLKRFFFGNSYVFNLFLIEF